MKSRQERLQQCVQYFKEREEFKGLLKKSKEKYRSLGRIGGNIKVTLLSKAEQDAFEAFFQIRYPVGEESKISLQLIEDKIGESRFGEFSLPEIMEAYFGEKLISRKDIKAEKDKRINQFWHDLKKEYEGTFVGEWLEMLHRSKDAFYHEITRTFFEGKEAPIPSGPDWVAMMGRLKVYLTAGNSLPILNNRIERLPVFATRVTGDPHFFDVGTTGNRFLTNMIYYYLGQRRYDILENTKIQLFYEAGILKEDLLNYTTIYGFRLYKKDGLEHSGAKGFFKEKEPFHLTLRTFSDIKRIKASTKLVHIVENSGVFSELIDRLAGKDVPLICTGGQLHVSSQIFLDMLVEDGFTLRYSGDFDPEGVEIARKLKKRYGESFLYWRYGIEDYRKAMSNKEITRDRLYRLEKIDDEALKEIIEVMKTERKAGYQEALLAEMMEDLL